MKNKKGILLSNVLKIILAVVVLTFLFYATYRVYTTITQDDEIKNAKAIIEKTHAKIEALEQGQSSTLIIQGFDSKEFWYLTGWGIEDETAPDRCGLSSCVCICSTINEKLGRDQISQYCQARGICREIESNSIIVASNMTPVEVFNALISGGGPVFDTTAPNILGKDNEILYETNSGVVALKYIAIPQNLAEIKLEKTTDKGKTLLLMTDD